MTELTALQKYACPACGAEARWDPGKRALVCPYCGTESAAELRSDGSVIEENDLLAALRGLTPDQRGWTAAKQTVRCRACNAVSVFDAERVAQNCTFCGSPALIAEEQVSAPITPSSQLPFQVPESRVREDLRRWYGSHWLAPGKLGQKALTDTLRGVYIPYWTFDAQADAPWQAEAGHYYYVTDNQGRSVRQVRWTPAAGRVQHTFDDVLVPASSGVHGGLLDGLEPYPTAELLPYDPGYLQGFVVEQYQVDLVQAERAARGRMEETLYALAVRQIPGDTYRNLRLAPRYAAQTFKHVLLPVWLLTYDYGRRSYQVVVNGHTGRISGEYPLSWIKVTLLVILGLIVAGTFLYFQQGQ